MAGSEATNVPRERVNGAAGMDPSENTDQVEGEPREPAGVAPPNKGQLPSSPLSRDPLSPGALPLPRWFAVLASVCAILLIPWIVYLAIALPAHQRFAHYDVAWVGFDIAMFLALAGLAIAAVKRSTWTEPLATCSATLLVMDAWFDVVTASHRNEVMAALASAFLIELPLAFLCGWVAHNTERLRRRAYRRLFGRLMQAEQAAARD
jgi:hypothetical protein